MPSVGVVADAVNSADYVMVTPQLRLGAVALAVVAIALACGPARTPAFDLINQASRAPSITLRASVKAKGFYVGTMLQPWLLGQPDDAAYARTLIDNFTLVTAPCYFAAIRPTRSALDYAWCDSTFSFARRHDLKVRGHTLVWGAALPPWVMTVSRDSLWTLLRDHVTGTVSRYRGRAIAWDVVNEAVRPTLGGSADIYRDTTLWHRMFGPAVYDSAFWWAHRSDPDANLFYNDYGIETSAQRADDIIRFANGLLARGVPIHGIGLQFHLSIRAGLDTSRIRRDIGRLAALGLEVHITELDVLIGHDNPTPEELARQAEHYRTVTHLCVTTPGCTALVVWGFTDRHRARRSVTWRDEPLLFDRNYLPKASYFAVLSELSRRP
jgi:endo-1,4-beta-xylanase